ncbi:helix-turn-helix domain-containing protein [Candidatus Avoscillospira sp. LCP25S3_F1]|uniref:helix-turn-helix domain-containing protein n=1 Tax=Candidatus Avoscillospira sp. LCP25S3_F1 TaxID=3438825 RepID=UPI003F8E09EB
MRYKYITYHDRQQISTRYLNDERVADIAAALGLTLATVYRELKRGETGALDHNQRMEYDPDIAQRRVQENLKRRGKTSK